jgi:hypothetical protein
MIITANIVMATSAAIALFRLARPMIVCQQVAMRD